MGQLEVECFATDELSMVLYAFAYGFDQSRGNSYEDRQIGILLKSNSAPSGPTGVTWSVVSTVRQDSLRFLRMAPACVVDPSGVFVAFSSRTNLNSQDPSNDRPGGIMYDPTLTPTRNSTGPGGWANINVPNTYPWKDDGSPSTVFYINDASGSYSIYHAFWTPLTATSISFGALDKAAGLMDVAPLRWALPTTGEIQRISFSATNIFVWNTPLDRSGDRVYSATLPQGPLSATIPDMHWGNHTATGYCRKLGVLGSQAYEFCTDSLSRATTYTLHVWDGKDTSPAITASSYIEESYAVIAGTITNGDTSFMIIQSNRLFENVQTNYMVRGLILSGPSAGLVQDVPNGISVPDSTISYIAGTDSQNKSLGTLGIVGIVLAVVVVIALVVIVMTRRRAKNRKALSAAAAVAAGEIYLDGKRLAETSETTLAVAAADGPIYPTHYYPQPVSQPGWSTNGQDPPLPVLGGSNLSPITEPVAEPMAANMGVGPTEAATTIWPVHMQASGGESGGGGGPSIPIVFSSHPRPNFVTTVGDPATSPHASSLSPADADSRLASSGNDSSAAMPWAPRPFDPHAWTASRPSATHASGVAAASFGASPAGGE
ncbi:hypothetical protein DFQ27_001237 [Actinomortierella ambigua]|uniref:Transmembrane protein n=1 Tax=Actinomortierella ambigua TaxID=1343610 RepID=A0A9P6UD24_9FUNG|nr:hypothetical protein DFQ27_001237 [Actinomortierella ambigua]